MRKLLAVFIVVSVLGFPVFCQESENLIVDGGFEKVREVILASEPNYLKWMESGTEFTRLGPFVLVPQNFSQPIGQIYLKIIDGQEGTDSHTGERAIQLEGSYWLKGGNCPVTEGDTFEAKFYAKGCGEVGLVLRLMDEADQQVGWCNPPRQKIDSNDEWIMVHQVFHVKDMLNVTHAWRALVASGRICIDDIELFRIQSKSD